MHKNKKDNQSVTIDYLDIYHVLIQKARGLKIHHVCKRVFLMLRVIRNYLQAELFYCRYYD